MFIRASKKRAPLRFAICALCTTILLVANWKWEELKDLERYTHDQFVRRGRKTAPDPRLVLIAIDQPSYEGAILESEGKTNSTLAALRGSYPWPRKVWADAVERLANAGAKAIVLDILFKSASADDEVFRAALDRFADRVVIGSEFDAIETDRGTGIQLVAPSATLISTTNTSAALDSRVGFVNVWSDWEEEKITKDDGVVRRARFRATNLEMQDAVSAPPDTVINSLDARALMKFGEGQRIPPGTEAHRFRFTTPPNQWPVILSLGDVLTPRIWELNYGNGAFFRDKLVLIGPTAQIMQDRHRTPFPEVMKGPEIHLNMINAALQGEFLRELPLAGNRSLILLAGLVAAALGRFILQPGRRLVVLVILGVGYLLGAFWLYNHANLFIVAVTPPLLLTFIGTTLLGYDFVVERLERMKLRHTMGLYFSPQVLEAVLADPGSMTPRRANVCMLLTDLRNSTPLAEILGPKGMFELLNNAFAVQTDSIMSEKGNLEHFLGDQFLSYWGAPKAQPDGADRALLAAQKLIMAMENLRATLPEPVAKLFGYGVALHSGSVLVGNKGSAQRLDYGLVGDAVNEAARIEALTKYYGVRLLVSRETISQFTRQGTRRLLDQIIVKGKSAPVDLFECENPCTPRYFAELCQKYKAAYDQYVFGNFAEAQAMFEQLVDEFGDGPSRALSSRCAQLAAAPPADWKGVWKMEQK